MKKLYGLISLAAAFALIICMLISSVELIAYYEPGFYEREYEKYSVKDALKMEMTDILYVTDEMMDYLKGYREDLLIETTVDGEEREFFNDREKAHMEDVKVLFQGGIYLRRWMLLLMVFCAGILFCTDDHPLRRLAKGYLAAGGVLLAALAGLTFCAVRDFTAVFTGFHRIFFDNDLWLLDPKTDLLINLLPESFFSDMGIHIAVVFAVMLLFCTVIGIIFLAVTRRKGKNL